MEENTKVSNFECLASCYDEFHQTHGHFVDLMLQEYNLSTDSVVADFGCGTGNETVEIFKRVGCTTFGLDPSSEMLNKARAKTSEITWLEAPAEETALPSESIDVITAFFSVHHFQDLSVWATETHRVLKESGRCFVFSISHEQMRESLEYRFFPDLLEHDLARVPSLVNVKGKFEYHGFEVFQEEIPYETRIIDEEYIEMVRNRYRSGFQALSDTQIERGIQRIKESMASSSFLIDPIRCTVLVARKGTTRRSG